MAVRTRIDSIASDINLIVNDLLSPEAQSKAVAEFARGAIAQADETNRSVLGRVPPRIITVDGNPGAPLEAVRPAGGSIIVEWELIGDVMVWIGQMLRGRSPVGPSGEYRDSHTLFADSKEVPIGADVPFADEYVFLNPVPYARRVEIGKTKAGRDFVISVPNRIYERTASDAKSRFGNIANIKFSYRAPEDFSILAYVPIVRTVVRNKQGRFEPGFSKGNRRAAAHERSLRVPAIVITMRAA
ncbi:hypothetical protein SAMN05216374_0973 [Tardiphaga sp. OK246]|uniref:hypothetical protein n=1 Tax=Tardiphaga sp. OK246 TaxID=1855307 RepID=UPI000B7543B7|nr:hypothetical protein [Tardiphaga sp. OK246]SNS36104.1 hypothetical protein SAMN05216374_0973 [Tardiphaga sp. OK246]